MGHHGQRLLAFLISVLLAGVSYGQDLSVLGLFADRAILKIDGETKLLKVGETYNDIKLVAVNAQEARLKIGNKEHTLGLGQDRGGIQTQQSEKAFVELSPNAFNQYRVNGVINGNIVEFLVDTGANTVSMSRNQAKRLGIDFRRIGQEGASRTASGVIKSWRVLLNKIKVGGITVQAVEATVRDLDSDEPILLGMSFLGQVRLEHEENRLRMSAK
ncbi:retropepsin-like aspartic protease family protein [Agitococcus lubricus]|uniref:Aspartyl protease family protein n=1 Tax=Agitococcus lubricus TaxID=1077255 RepID=A0A2T5IUR0_9GAMM|nr:retropepsin-like aspartic protease [Agitococcus lubricus]PTQ87541.1 aspartyl protease family protein [Agitococcus lubricus]